MKPEDVLNTQQILPTGRITHMLARHGFSCKRTNGSHSTWIHTEYTDLVVVLVYKSKDHIYQKTAAKACLESQARAQAMHAQSIPHDPLGEYPELPVNFEYITYGNTTYIRPKAWPVLGVAYTGAHNVLDALKSLSSDVHKLDECIKNAILADECAVRKTSDGSLYIKHVTYPIEELILPYGINQQASYPLEIMDLLSHYVHLYDVYLHTGDLVTDLPQDDTVAHYSITPQNNGQLRYDIAYKRSHYEKMRSASHRTMFVSGQGRMTPASMCEFVKDAASAKIKRIKSQEKSGLIMQPSDDGKMVIGHKFLDKTFVSDCLEQALSDVEATLEILTKPVSNIEEMDEWVESLLHGFKRIDVATQVLDKINTQMDEQAVRLIPTYKHYAKTLTSFGYMSLQGHTPDGAYSEVTFKHKDPNYPTLKLLSIPQDPTSKHYVVMPHPEMVSAMGLLIQECKRKMGHTQKPSSKTAFVLQARSKPIKNSTSLGSATLRGFIAKNNKPK